MEVPVSFPGPQEQSFYSEKKIKALLMFKTIRVLSPAYLQNFFSIRGTPY